MTAAVEALAGQGQSLLRRYADDAIAEGPFVPRQGHVTVPDGPGLGVTLDEAALRRATERYAREGPYDLSTAPPLPHH